MKFDIFYTIKIQNIHAQISCSLYNSTKTPGISRQLLSQASPVSSLVRTRGLQIPLAYLTSPYESSRKNYVMCMSVFYF